MHVFLWFLVTFGLAERGLEFPVHDGRERLINLKKKNFDRFVKKYDILLVYFYAPPKNDLEEHNWELTKELVNVQCTYSELNRYIKS